MCLKKGKIINFLIIIVFIIVSLNSCAINIQNNDKLKMESEIIRFDLYDEKSDILIDFNLISYYLISYTSPINFPVDDYLSYSSFTGFVKHFDVKNFKVTHNDESISSKKLLKSYNHPLDGKKHEAYWYVYNVYFPSKEVIQTTVRYSIPSEIPESIPKEDLSYYNRMSHYVIHTGKFWKDTIEKMTIIINIMDSNIDKKILFLIDGSMYELEVISEYENVFENMEPEEDIFLFYNYNIKN